MIWKQSKKRKSFKTKEKRKGVIYLLIGFFLLFTTIQIPVWEELYAKEGSEIPEGDEVTGTFSDLPSVMDLQESGLCVYPEAVENNTVKFLQECISGNGTYYARENYFLTGRDIYGNHTKMYCIQPQKHAPSSKTNYEEYQIYEDGTSTVFERAATLCVLMYGFGGYGSVNIPNFFSQSGSTQDGGSFGVYVVGDENSSKLVTGLLINGELNVMDDTAARALTAATIHRLNGATSCGAVTGYKRNHSYDQGVVNAANLLYDFGAWAGDFAANYGLQALIDRVSSDEDYKTEQEIRIMVWSPAQNSYVDLPGESGETGFDWSPFLDSDRQVKFKVTYTASKMESRLLMKNASGTDGKLTYSHERATTGLDGQQGYYDYISVSEREGNELFATVSYGPLLSDTKLTYRPGVKIPTKGIGFSQEVFISTDGDMLMGGKTLDLQIVSGDGASFTPIYGNGDLGEDGMETGNGSYYSARFFSSPSAQDVAFASPRQNGISRSARLFAKGTGGSVELQKNSKEPQITDGNDSYSLAGAVYRLYPTREDADRDSNAIATLTTDENGYARADLIAAGRYFLKEVASPKGYALDTECYTVDVQGNHTKEAPLRIVLQEPVQLNPMELLLYKVDKDHTDIPLANAEYTVKYYKGQYAEDPALLGISPERSWVLQTDDGTENPDDKGKLFFSEKSKISGDNFYYTENGTPALPLGTVTIQESKAPEGYHLSDTVFVRQITGEGMSESVTTYQYPTELENPVKQAFQIVKLGETKDGKLNPLAGAGFMACRTDELETDKNGNYIWDETKAVILTENEEKELFTNEEGYAKSIPLFYGTYVVRETTVPPNYLPVEDFFVTVESDENPVQTLRYFEDESFRAYLRIIKKDEETGKNILNNSATFKIFSYGEEKYLSLRTYHNSEYIFSDEFSTNEKGELITPEPLMPGKYRIEEIGCPKNYYCQKDLTGIDIEIGDSGIYESYIDENGKTTDMGIFTVEIENIPLTGQLKIQKEGETDFWDEKTGTYETGQIPLAGVSFGIYAAEDIYFSDGQGNLCYSAGDLIETILTDDEGRAESSAVLPVGKYLVKETEAPDRYELGEDFCFEVSEDGNTIWINGEDGEKKIDLHEEKLLNKKKLRIETTAKDAVSLTETAELTPEVTVIDTVYMEGLEPGHHYTIKGIVMDKESNTPLLVDGEKITGITEFTAENEVQNTDVSFTFATRELAEKETEIVLFEYLFDEAYPEELVASHEDINEKKQTIYLEPKIPDTPEEPRVPDTPKTGDLSSVFPAVLAMIAAVAGIAILIWRRKQK